MVLRYDTILLDTSLVPVLIILQDLSMMTVVEENGWKLDTNFLEPVSSQLFGGAHMDRAVLDVIRHSLLQHGNPPGEIDKLIEDVYEGSGYFEAKTDLTDLEYAIGGDKVKNKCPLTGENIEDISGEIRVDGGMLVVGQ